MWTEWQTGAKILPCPKLRLRAVISTLKFNSHRSNLIPTLHDRGHHLYLVILLIPAEWIQCFPGSCTPLLHSQQTLSLLHKRCLYLRVATCQPTGFAYCVQGSENPSGKNILISDHHRTEVPVPAHHFEPVCTRCLQAMFFVPYLKKVATERHGTECGLRAIVNLSRSQTPNTEIYHFSFVVSLQKWI